ncbi:MAG: histidine kinase, partial [Bacteroidota bacterium]
MKISRIRLQQGDTGHIALSYMNLGTLEIEAGNFDLAQTELEKAVELFERHEDNNGLTAALNSMGYLYQVKGEFETALFWFDRACALSDSGNFKGELAYCLSSAAAVHLQLKQYRRAVEIGESAFELATENDFQLEIRDASQTLAQAYTALGRHPEAYEAQRRVTAINDSIFNTEKSQLVAELVVSSRLDQKERQIEDLEHARELQEIHLRTQTWLWAAGMLFVLLVFLIVGLIRRQRLQRKAAGIRHRLQELEQMALQSQMNPHFIFNCLSAIQGLVLENNTDRAVHYLSEFGRLLRRVLENAGEGQVSLASELEILRSYLTLEKMQGEAEFDYEIELEQGLVAENERVAPMLLQPFVENAIRHG